jgi:hypothetical protein
MNRHIEYLIAGGLAGKNEVMDSEPELLCMHRSAVHCALIVYDLPSIMGQCGCSLTDRNRQLSDYSALLPQKRSSDKIEDDSSGIDRRNEFWMNT